MLLSYESLNINNKLIWNLRDMGHIIRHMREGRGSQKRVLFILHRAEAMTQSALTEYLGIQPGSASEVVGKLENAGLLTRTSNPSDHRTMMLQLTELGKSQVEEAQKERNKIQEEMFSVLEEEEQETLLILLEKLHSDWTQRYPKQRGRKHHRGK